MNNPYEENLQKPLEKYGRVYAAPSFTRPTIAY